jgi:hypothetical protein
MTSELDPQARALIGLALKGEQRLPRSRERVKHGVLAALAAPAALGVTEAAAAGKAASVAGSATTTSTKALLFGGAAWLKVVPLVAVGITASVVGLKQRQAPPSARQAEPAHAVAAPVAAPTANVASPNATPEPPAAEPAVEGAGAEQAAGAAKLERPSTPARSAEPPLNAHAPPSLAGDLEALQRAQRTLNAGNAAGALRELQAVRGSALRAERTALEVFAHCALGNVAQARQQASLFRRLAPHSPLLARIDASCAAP